MSQSKEAYHKCFNAITDAIETMEQLIVQLKNLQLATEELFMKEGVNTKIIKIEKRNQEK